MSVTLSLNDVDTRDGLYRFQLGETRLAVREDRLDRLKVKFNKTFASLKIVGRGVFCRLTTEDARVLTDLIPGLEEQAKPKAPKWEKGQLFEIMLDDGINKVYGWRQGGWGIAVHFVVDGEIRADDEDRQPPRNLTHLKTGLAVCRYLRSVPARKRLAQAIDESVPELAKAEDPNTLTPEQKAKVKSLVAEAKA